MRMSIIIALLVIGVAGVAILVAWNGQSDRSERVLCGPNGCAHFD
jgi:hypothetical protein